MEAASLTVKPTSELMPTEPNDEAQEWQRKYDEAKKAREQGADSSNGNQGRLFDIFNSMERSRIVQGVAYARGPCWVDFIMAVPLSAQFCLGRQDSGRNG